MTDDRKKRRLEEFAFGLLEDLCSDFPEFLPESEPASGLSSGSELASGLSSFLPYPIALSMGFTSLWSRQLAG